VNDERVDGDHIAEKAAKILGQACRGCNIPPGNEQTLIICHAGVEIDRVSRPMTHLIKL
jgi:hypothetical protein